MVNLATLIEEIHFFEQSGLDYHQRLWISPRCHVVMPYHPLIEEIYEKARGEGRTGTTRRGMGPVHADKVSYNGIRLYDLADKAVFAEKLRLQLAIKNPTFQAFGMPPLDFEAVYQEKLEQYARLAAFVREPYALVQETLKEGALSCWRELKAPCWITTGAPIHSAPLRPPWPAGQLPAWASLPITSGG